MAQLVHQAHPFAPNVIQNLAVGSDKNVSEVLELGGIDALLDLVIQVNGVPADRDSIVNEEDLITVATNMHGGGGGGSNPLSAVLMLASIAVPFAFPGLGLVGTALLRGAISIGGQLLISSGTSKPPRAPTRAINPTPSPTYSVGIARNNSRANEVMPMVIGTHRVVPDISANPFTVYYGNKQLLYQTFNVGMTEVSVSDIRIGDSPLSDYAGVEVHHAKDTGFAGGFPGDVVSQDGAELTFPASYITRTSASNAVALQIDLLVALYSVDAQTGGIISHSVQLEAEYRRVGDISWTGFFSSAEIPLTHYWSAGKTIGGFWDQIDFDYAFAPYSASQQYKDINGDDVVGYTWRLRPFSEIDSDTTGHYATQPTAARFQAVPSATLVLSSSSQTPIRRSYTRPVASGTYEIRVRRLSADETDSKFTSNTTLSQIKAYQKDLGDYEGQTRVGIRIRASGQLNGALDSVSLLAVGVCPASIAVDTQPSANSNPGWWSLYLLRGKRFRDGRPMFGALLPDSRLDLDSFEAFANYCDSRGFTCNAVIDQNITTVEAVEMIARCGRGRMSWSSGKLGIIYSQSGDLPVAMFTMSNIIAGSFSIDYASENTPEEVVATYTDEDDGYKERKIRVRRPNLTDPSRTIDLSFPGITRQEQVIQEANLVIASQLYHRRVITFQTDMEGFVIQKGDVVYLAHDLTLWAYSGRVVDVAVDDQTITLSRPVDGSLLGNDVAVTFRYADGTLATHSVIPFSTTTDVILLDSVVTGSYSNVNDIMWLMGPEATPGRTVRITEVTPKGENRVELAGHDEVQAYWNAENGAFDVITTSGLLSHPPAIKSVNVYETLIDLARNVSTVTMDFILTDGSSVLLMVGTNGGDLEDVSANVVDGRFKGTYQAGDRIDYEARGNRLGAVRQGSLVSGTYLVLGIDANPRDITGARVTRLGNDIRFTWDHLQDVDIAYYEIRKGTAWASAQLIGRSVDNFIQKEDPGIGTYLIRAFDLGGRSSVNDAVVSIGIGGNTNYIFNATDGLTGTYFQTIASGTNIVLDSLLGLFYSDGYYITEAVDLTQVEDAVRTILEVDTTIDTGDATRFSEDGAHLEYFTPYYGKFEYQDDALLGAASGVSWAPDGLTAYIMGNDERVYQYPAGVAWDVDSLGAQTGSVLLSGDDTEMTDMFWKPDGTILYTVGTTGNSIYEYAVSPAWDLAGLGTAVVKSVATEDTDPTSIYISPDGINVYICGTSSGRIHQYSMTAWDISTLSAVINNFDFSSEDAAPESIHFSPNGSILYMGAHSGDATIYQYPLTAPWDLTTVGLPQAAFRVPEVSNNEGMFLKSDGKQIYVVGTPSGDINSFRMSTSWDVATATATERSIKTTPSVTGLDWSLDGMNLFAVDNSTDLVYNYPARHAFNLSSLSASSETFSVGGDDTSPEGLVWSSDGMKLYVIGTTTNRVYEYDAVSAWTLTGMTASGNELLVSGETTAPRDLAFNTDGTKIFVLGAAIYEYHLSTGWDLSTVGTVQETSIVPPSPAFGFAFSSNGEKVYTVEFNTNDQTINEHVLTTAFDVSTMAAASASYVYATTADTWSGITFNSSGSAFYVSDLEGDVLREIELAESWNIATANNPYVVTDFSGDDNLIKTFFWRPDGKKLYMAGQENDNVYEYDCSISFDPSSATLNYTLDISGTETDPQGLSFSEDGTRFYFNAAFDAINARVWEFEMTVAWDISTATATGEFLATSGDTVSSHGWNADGTKIYTLDEENEVVSEYVLSSAWDLSTVAAASATLSLGSFFAGTVTTYKGVKWNDDGTSLLTYAEGSTKSLVEFIASTPYSLASISSYARRFALSPTNENIGDFSFGKKGNRLFSMSTDSKMGALPRDSAESPWSEWTLPWSDYSEDNNWTWAGNNVSSSVSMFFEYRITDDDPAGSPVWTDWASFVQGYYTFRAIQFKISMSAVDAQATRPVIEAITVSIDVPDRIEQFEDQLIDAGGTALTFIDAFKAPPVVEVTVQDGSIGDTVLVTSKTNAGVTIQIHNSSGTGVAGNVDVLIRGY